MDQLYAIWREIIRIDCEPESKIPVTEGLVKIQEIAHQFVDRDSFCFAFRGELDRFESETLADWIAELPALDFLLCRDNGEILAITEEEHDYFVYRRMITAQQAAALNG